MAAFYSGISLSLHEIARRLSLSTTIGRGRGENVVNVSDLVSLFAKKRGRVTDDDSASAGHRSVDTALWTPLCGHIPRERPAQLDLI